MGSNIQKIAVLCVAAALVAVAGFFVLQNNPSVEHKETEESQITEQTETSQEGMENSTGSEKPAQEGSAANADTEDTLGQKNKAENLTAVQAHSVSLQFSGQGFGYPYQGTFKDIAANIDLTGNRFAKALFRIQADSVDAGNFLVNSQLKSESFLSVEDYPEILLVIDSVEFTQAANANVSARATIRGITNSLDFPATIDKSGLSADFTLDISQYGVSHPNIDKEVRMQLSATWVDL